MPLIKSHSNYVLKSKHQTINDGTIWERDITTIGGLNQFAPGQTPIYKSSNFIITVRNDRRTTNQYNTKKWEKGISGDVWTLESIKDMVSDFDTENDTKIVLKHDYYDFRDFAYYGSLTELFRSSITDILARFPGELYFSENNVYYEKRTIKDGEVIIENQMLGDGDFIYHLENPFNIDIHSEKRPIGENVLKYFAEGGYENYELINECEDTVFDFEVLPVILCDDCFVPGDRIDGCCNCDSIINFKITEIGSRNSRGKRSKTTKVKGEVKQIKIRLYKGNNGEIYYIHDGSLAGYHLRPKHEFLVKFYNESNDFEKLILDFNTTPRYSSTFSVIHENDFGYYREFEDFIFPTSNGGYNPTIDENFISNLVGIGEFYDERFTDNLYRAMTHEAIKNFDWTYTREYEEGEELEYIAGGKKIQKALRVFAREFDEIKAYIDNIRFMNRITYDERSNIPDYFLSDTCDKDGWDVKYVIPYDVKLTKNGVEYDDYSYETLFENTYNHEYSQNSKEVVTPYTKENIKDGSENGYFMDCTSADTFDCWLNDIYNGKIRKTVPVDPMPGSVFATECGQQYETISILEREDGTERITNRIKPFTDETEYSYMSINNEFLRRLALNSKYIWRHKGTVEGIEMILGMFGLKSKRWLEHNESMRYKMAADSCNPGKCETPVDYEIKEYTSFTERIEEEWDVEHQMYRIDWVNSTKTIVYDYRSQSNYTLPGSIGITQIPYQGIPVSYREEYPGSSDKYLPYIDEMGNKILKRYLYPNFDKNEQLDGHPYFQMDGGWLSKKLTGGANQYNFQFDVDDNIVHNQYLPEGNVTPQGFINDNRPLYKETIRSIKRVDTLAELVSVPQNELHNGIIYYVGRVSRDIAVIDGNIYDIIHEGDKRYVSYKRQGGFINIGDKYFDESIVVYNKDGVATTYYIDDKNDGYEVKAYLNSDTDFITYNSDNPAYTITTFQVISDKFEEGDAKYSNYYKLEDVTFSNNIAYPGTRNGWRRITETEYDYLKINTITNYYEGNNGHNGNMVYDNGHEYFTYFNRIFKYAFDTGQFDSRCYTDGFDWLGGEVFDYGFSGLIDKNEEIKQYDKFLLEDEKIHYFGNYKKNLIQVCEDPEEEGYDKPNECSNDDDSKRYLSLFGNETKKIVIYGDYHRFIAQPSDGTQMADEDVKKAAKLSIARSLNLAKKEKNEQTGKYEWNIVDNSREWTEVILKKYNISSIDDLDESKKEEIKSHVKPKYDIEFITSVTGLTTYNEESLAKIGTTTENVDDVTNQIVNNKRLKIIFNMKYPFNSKEGQCELKYIDDIVMNYLTQLVPSTAIFDVEYKYCQFNYNGC